jgi:hypothetical protein
MVESFQKVFQFNEEIIESISGGGIFSFLLQSFSRNVKLFSKPDKQNELQVTLL